MKLKNDEEPQISDDQKIIVEEENIQYGERETPLFNNISIRESTILGINNPSPTFFQKIKNKLSKIPFSLHFFFILIIILIIIILGCITYYIQTEPNFIIYEPKFEKLPLNNREYENYLFDNGLEVMLIHDKDFDRDGGAIIIDKGYLDNPLEEGLSTFATSLLSYLAFFGDVDDIKILEDYFGHFRYGTEECYINFRFDILNNGYKKFFPLFSQILNFNNINNITDFNIAKNKAIQKIQQEYNNKKNYIIYRENHLLEYFVYGFKNETNGDILPEGNIDIINKTDINTISNYIHNFINPSKIKIVLFSKYKFLISSKYMKYYFKYLTSMKNVSHKNNNTNDKIMLNTSQIFYIKANYYELNYIKIIYYINKIGNESFSELNYKQRYLYYISDFINKIKNGSLYSSFKSKIKSIDANLDDEIITLKTKIKFIIKIELNSLENINDIIYGTYQYMHKIVFEAIEKGIQMDRYDEIYEMCDKNVTLTEKTFNTNYLAFSNAIHLIETEYNQKEFFHWYCVPKEKNSEEMIQYFKQLTPNNSVIILAIRDKDIKKLTCNKTSKFHLDCNYLKNESNIKVTNYYDVEYINDVFNSTQIDEYLNKDKDIDNIFDITFESNRFKTKYKYANNKTEKEEDDIKFFNYTNTLNSFYYKKNINFRVQRVLIKLNLYHPYLRNNGTNETDKKCNYFLIMEMFYAIKRKINEELYDALNAFAQIHFFESENHLEILVFCFEDQVYNISEKIKNIIYNTDWTKSDFFDKNEIYKNEAFDDHFNFDKSYIQKISYFYFSTKLKHNLYNLYEFFPEEFEKNGYNEYIYYAKNKSNILKDLTSFIVDIYIYGFYSEEKAKKIYDLFNHNNIENFTKLLNETNISISPEKYVDWTKEIIDLDNIENNITIHENVYNITEDGNIGLSYRIFKENVTDLLDISIFQTIIDTVKGNENSSLISHDMFKYKNYIFELIFADQNIDEKIPNENLVIKEWNELLNNNNYEDLTKQVDKIGNRLYYLIKNFILNLDKKQTSLYLKGLSEIDEHDFNGTVIDPYKIISKYNKKYIDNDKKFNENDLNSLIDYYNKTMKNTFRVNIFVGGK